MMKKQDLSLKCSAWKGFIPRLQWKSQRFQKNIQSGKMFEKNFVFGKNLGLKQYWVEKLLGLKKF